MSRQMKNRQPQLQVEAAAQRGDGSPSHSARKRISLGVPSDPSPKYLWNRSEALLLGSPPPRKQHHQDYSELLVENERLKEEIKTLQKMVFRPEDKNKSHHKLRSYDRESAEETMLKNSVSTEITKLKKIIEKSYYSIREMEKQLEDMREKLRRSERSCENLHSQLKISEFQRDQLSRKINTLVLLHRQEIEVCNDRAIRLESKIEHLVGLIEQDHRDWSHSIEQLNNFSKFSSQRAYK